VKRLSGKIMLNQESSATPSTISAGDSSKSNTTCVKLLPRIEALPPVDSQPSANRTMAST
jgi:hypothetical protein